jgi:hypothetical protein
MQARARLLEVQFWWPEAADAPGLVLKVQSRYMRAKIHNEDQ